MGCFIYCLFGTSKDITLGPTAIMSLMTAAFAASPIPGDATYAIVLTLVSGCFQLLMGILSLGKCCNTKQRKYKSYYRFSNKGAGRGSKGIGGNIVPASTV